MIIELSASRWICVQSGRSSAFIHVKFPARKHARALTIRGVFVAQLIQPRYIYTLADDYRDNFISHYTSRAAPYPLTGQWLRTDRNYPSRISDRTTALHSVNFPSGRVPRVTKFHLIEISNVRLIRPPITSPAKHPFLQQSSLSRAKCARKKNKISLCSRYGPEACDGRIQKSEHSRPNCR